MPPKKGKAHKQRAPRLSEDEDELVEYLDVQYNPDIVCNLLEELRIQTEAKCNQLQKDSDFIVMSIQQSFHMEMIKLPTQVRQMSLARFKQEFGESAEAVTRGAMMGSSKSAAAQNAHATAAKSRASTKVFQTPMASRNAVPQTPSTSLRNPKEGETLLSANGSPLGTFNTVVKAPRQGHDIVPPTPGVFVPLSSGEVVDIENVDMDNMTLATKEDTLARMQSIMSTMQSFMTKLEQTNPIS